MRFISGFAIGAIGGAVSFFIALHLLMRWSIRRQPPAAMGLSDLFRCSRELEQALDRQLSDEIRAATERRWREIEAEIRRRQGWDD